MATSTRMFVPYRYRPGYVAATEGQLRGGWQYSLLINDELIPRDTVYTTRSLATAAMLAEVNELILVYCGRGRGRDGDVT